MTSWPAFTQLKPTISYPISPEVATLGKFVDMPVGTYTGVPDISVPLYTVKYKSISIPLTLSYHAGGIKVDEEATWVGLGWDLFSGGFISQAMIGDSEPYLDEQLPAPGYFSEFEQRFDPLKAYDAIAEYNSFVTSGCLNDADDSHLSYAEKEAFIISQYLKRGWGQPDVYTFSFLGRSGKFVIHPVYKTIFVLQKSEELKIERTGTQPTSGWRIRSSDGMTFLFELRGTGLQNVQLNSQTWKLTSITSIDGAKVSFEYKSQYTQGVNVNESYKSSLLPLESGPYSSVLTLPTVNNDYYLSKIITPTETVEFVLGNRSDIKGKVLPDGSYSVKKLQEIIVKDRISNKVKRSFEFSYTDFIADETGNGYSTITPGNRDVLCRRLKLDTLKEVGYDAADSKVYNPPYIFKYDETIPLPPKCSFAVDYWGYYNGRRDNSTYLPDLVPLHLTLPEYNAIPFKLLRSPYKANRGPSAPHMQAGILKKIVFPTGGSKVFTYESNTFSNFTFYDVNQIDELDTLISIYDMNIPGHMEASKSIGALPREMRVNFEIKINPGIQAETFDNIRNSTVILRKKYPNGTFGTPVKIWGLIDNIENRREFDRQIAANGFFTITEDVLLTPEDGTTYWVTANLADNLAQQTPPATTASIGCYVRYYAASANGSPLFYGAGLRIARVELFDENDRLSYRKDYAYTMGGNTSGLLLSPPKFLSTSRRWFTELTPDDNCGMRASTHLYPYDRWTVTSGSNISLAFSSNGGSVGYGRVTVSERSTSSTATNAIMQYEFLNKENLFAIDFPEVPNLDNGLPLRTTWMTDQGVPVKKEEYAYHGGPEFYFYGYTVEDKSVGGVDCHTCQSPEYALMIKRFILRRYRIQSRFYKMVSKTETMYGGTNALIVSTSYTYNGLGLRSGETSTNSANDVIRKEYKYPVDFPPTDSVIANLTNKFFLPLLEERYFFNNTLQKKTVNTFRYLSPSKHVVKSVNLLNSTAKACDFINYTAYSSLTGNPKELIGKNGINTVILWGRNGTVPVAKIEGATLAQVDALVNSTSIETMSPASLRPELMKLYQLPNCLAQVYQYDDKAQLIEIIDPSKTSVHFEYDAFGRLALTRDHRHNIISNYQYRFTGTSAQ
jgi:YD repeat-containing protein